MLPPKKEKSVNKITLQGARTNPAGEIVAPTAKSLTFTKKNEKSRTDRDKQGFRGSEDEGVKVDKAGLTTAKPFTRTVVESPGGYVRILGDDRTVLTQGRKGTKLVDDAIKASKNKATDVNQRRENHARSNNLTGGLATDITRKESNQLNADGQTTGYRVAKTAKEIAATEKEKELRQLTETRVAKRIALAKETADKLKRVRLPKN